MILEEQVSPTRIKHWSDQNVWIRQIETGILYEEAVDAIPCRYTYEETDQPIIHEEVKEEEPSTEDKPEEIREEELPQQE